MITVTFTAATLFQGSMRSIGSTLSVTETDARVLVDIGVATAPGVTPQGGWPTGELSDTFLAKADNLTGLANSSTARTNLGLGGLATLNDAPSDGSEYVRKNAAWSIATGGGGGGGGIDVQVFGSSTSSGTFSGASGWQKPANAKVVLMLLIGAGGGGSAGARQPTTIARSGGGGAASGATFYGYVHADSLASQETVIVGTGGNGGAARTTNGTPVSGAAGTSTVFSNFRAILGAGGNAQFGGNSGTTYIFSANYTLGTAGGGTTTTGGSAPNITATHNNASLGGGGAGAGASSTTNAAGGSGGSLLAGSNRSDLNSNIAGGTFGTASGVAATNGISQNDARLVGGTGGGGGFYRTGQAGGTGGNGGWPGGGGGGGGAADEGFDSGAGGNGAHGVAVIVTYCY